MGAFNLRSYSGFLSIWLLCIFVAGVVVVVAAVNVVVVVIVDVDVVVKSLLKRTQLYSGGVIWWSISKPSFSLVSFSPVQERNFKLLESRNKLFFQQNLEPVQILA